MKDLDHDEAFPTLYAYADEDDDLNALDRSDLPKIERDLALLELALVRLHRRMPSDLIARLTGSIHDNARDLAFDELFAPDFPDDDEEN